MNRKFGQNSFNLAIKLLGVVFVMMIFISKTNPVQAAFDACNNPFMPLNAGFQIEYRNQGMGSATSYTMKVTEVDSGSAKLEYHFSAPQNVVYYHNITCSNGNISTDAYMDFGSGVATLQMKTDTENVEGVIIPEDLHVGSSWITKYSMITHYEGKDVPANMPSFKMIIKIQNQAVGEEKVDVPAGTFKAIKVISTATSDYSMQGATGTAAASGVTMPASSSSVTMTEWWVKGIGLVKVSFDTNGSKGETVAVRINGAGGFWDDPTVEAVAEKAVAPAAAAAATVNTAIATQSLVSTDLLRYLIFFFSQPLLLLKRKKRQAWGTVYNSLSGLPEDLAILRLYDSASKLVSTQVTDTSGTFSFLAQPGKYRITVQKRNFVFPTKVLENSKEDGQYTDLYHGENITIGKNDEVLSPNIPIDPALNDLTDAKIRKKYNWQKYQGIIALTSPALSTVSLLIKFSLPVFVLFILSIIMYFFFRRFATVKLPKKFGKVTEEKSSAFVPDAVLRIFALPFNKLFGYRVSDSRGRYNFLVGSRKFVMMVNKNGYQQAKTEPFDFSQQKGESVIAKDISLKKSGK